jgi:ABC-type bacteriocin/lantibiotic exporter with double-glycine peptidase domain
MWRWNKRLEAMLASEAGSDSAAALTMIVRYHRRSVTIHQVRQALDASGPDPTAHQVIEAAAYFSLRARGLVIDHPRLIDKIPTPNIAHMLSVSGDFSRPEFGGAGYFAVVASASARSRRVDLIDPYSGRADVTLSEFFDFSSGIFLVFDEASPPPRAKLLHST